MTTQQPEALRLADDRPTSLNDDLYQWAIDAEDTLRRLHEANQELLAALKEIDSWLVCACIATPEDMAQSFSHMEQVASAAINKAERTTT